VIVHVALITGALYFVSWQSLAGVLFGVDILVFAATLGPATGLCRTGRLGHATLLWSGILFGVGLPLMAANAEVVVWRAESVAGDRPYCIEYASPFYVFDYEPAETLFDLTAFKMQARLLYGGMHPAFFGQHHAILVMQSGEDKVFLNWSYAREDFVGEVLNRRWYNEAGKHYLRPKASCKPDTHYARHLPVWSMR
jgi:hypothetical protein